MLEHRFQTLEIQRAHRVPTGPPRQEQPQSVTWQGARIMFFLDYSRQTMERRVSFNQVKADLKNRGVEYMLRFPVTLEIKHNGVHHRFTSTEEASEFVKRKIINDC